MKTYLVTGGLGFIGLNFIKSVISNEKNFIINLDKKTYASNEDIFTNQKNYKFFHGDILDKKLVSKIFKNYKIDIVVNFAAESHVDNSFSGPDLFFKTNTLGSQNLIEIAHQNWKNKKNKLFLQISTDEVYGSSNGVEFFETDNCHPSSPYSLTKYFAEIITQKYIKEYNFPAIITRSSNNFGFYQHPEKLIPKTFLSCVLNQNITLYKSSKYHKRNWLFVEDNVKALNLIIEKGKIGEIYNICSNTELENIEMIKKIIKFVKQNINNKISTKKIKIEDKRKLDDERYLINSDKIKKLGFKPTNFEENFEKTMIFYQKNLDLLINQNKRNFN